MWDRQHQVDEAEETLRRALAADAARASDGEALVESLDVERADLRDEVTASG